MATTTGAARHMVFLRNVKLSDCINIDDLFEEKLMDQVNDDPQPVEVGPKLPDVYKGLKTWPKTTKLLCWHCNLAFDDIPVFIPKSIEPIDGGASNLSAEPVTRQEVAQMWNNGGERQEYSTIRSTSKYAMGREGCFCSFNCALAFIDLHYPKYTDNHNKRGMLEILFHEFCGKRKPLLFKSPDPHEMTQYGGEVTPAEYKKKIIELQLTSGITPQMRISWRESSFKSDQL